MTKYASNNDRYQSPRLTEFGKVVDLTAGGSKNADESGKGNMP